MTTMPRWMRELPFVDALIVPWNATLLFALFGVFEVLVGILLRNPWHFWGGIALEVPFLILFLLLWETYRSDGYKR